MAYVSDVPQMHDKVDDIGHRLLDQVDIYFVAVELVVVWVLSH